MMSVFDDGGPVTGAGPIPASTGAPDARLTDEQRAVLSAYAEALGADAVLDREYTDEQLESSPYAEMMSEAVPVGQDEYRGRPADGGPSSFSAGGVVVGGVRVSYLSGQPDVHLAESQRQALVGEAQEQLDEPVLACPTCWRSHGCDLPAGHPGDDYSHVCDPCPDGCSEPDLEDWPDGWSASVGRCSVHCGDHPISGDRLFDVTRAGSTNERVLP
jgi:hypothetical protein